MDKTSTSAPDGATVATQQAILRKLRAGASFTWMHKEGSTRVFHDGRSYVQADEGDWSARNTFADEAALLAMLRLHFDHETRNGLHGDPLAEARAWRVLESKLEPPAGSLQAAFSGRPVGFWLAAAATMALSGGLAYVRYVDRGPRPEPVVLQAPPSAPPSTDWQAKDAHFRQGIEAAKAAAASR